MSFTPKELYLKGGWELVSTHTYRKTPFAFTTRLELTVRSVERRNNNKKLPLLYSMCL